MDYRFAYATQDKGIAIWLEGKPVLGRTSRVAVSAWHSHAPPQARQMVGRIMEWLLDDESDTATQAEESVLLSHASIAALNTAQAQSLSLPANSPLVLELRTSGLITEPGFRVAASWRDRSGRPETTLRVGAILILGSVEYRIPEPLFSIIEEVEHFRSLNAPGFDERCAALARLQESLPFQASEQLITTGAVRAIRVVHAAAFSLSLRQEKGEINFDPVLFGPAIVKRKSLDEKQVVDESQSLLAEADQAVFAKRFGQWQEARNAYPVQNGVYVFVDAALKPALDVVRKKQNADSDTRWAFARNPQNVLRERLADEDESLGMDSLFVETEQYSRRVVEIGIWERPVLPWIQGEPNAWLPERFGIRIGDRYLSIEPKELPELVKKIEIAIGENVRTVAHHGEQIAANPQTLGALRQLVGQLEKPQPESRQHHQDFDSERRQTVLLLDQNFEAVNFESDPSIRRVNEGSEGTTDSYSTLKPHQHEGLRWLQKAWKRGYPGVLLADDMGLGKTLQALVFLRWIQQVSKRKSPILIVAPTGLLPNWKSEHNKHLVQPGLGDCLQAYGAGLRRIRTHKSTDLKRGTAGLDRAAIGKAGWILTSYETLRDYHLSIAPVRFACVVFDEIQKAKNPASLISHATKTLNADFALGLTGTPIENRIEDLWSIMDTLSPGLLGDLKSFSRKYSPGGEDPEWQSRSKRLRSQLFDSRNGRPPFILRRMKNDRLKGLPRKLDDLRRNDMPRAQSEAYDQALLKFRGDSGGRVLELIHKLRGHSLHPFDPKSDHADDTGRYIQQSARLTELFRILCIVSKRNEKALVFLESLDMQDLLAVVIQRKFGLKHKPLQINGRISGKRRQQLVDEFQEKRGIFDVMILSPRAGGVGLTLTAANHVIHLSRWWNPAVEDQCTDRTFRIGQERDVHVYYPLAIHPKHGDSSFDSILDRLLKRKRRLSRDLLVPPVNTKNDMAWMEQELTSGRSNRPQEIADAMSPEDIDRMEWQAFERWAINCLRKRGYQSFLTATGADGGADVVARHPDNEGVVIVQCKHTSNPERGVPAGVVKELLRARENYGHPEATLVGLSNAKNFSGRDQKDAERHGVYLIDREALQVWPRHCFL